MIDVNEALESLDNIVDAVRAEIEATNDLEKLSDLRKSNLGLGGTISQQMKRLAEIAPASRSIWGESVTDARDEINQWLSQRLKVLMGD